MSLLFLDSFDHFLDASDKYLSGGTSITPNGRHGNGYTGSLRLALIPTHSRVIIGAAFKWGSTFQVVHTLFDINATVCAVRTANDGALEVQVGNHTVRTPSDTVRVNQWHYLECDLTVTVAFVDPFYYYSLSPARLILDGLTVLDETVGPSIPYNGPVSVYGWAFIDLMDNAFGTMDDLYVCDGSGPAPHNAPLGDIQIDVIRPNGPGAASEWTAVGASPNWNAVNDLTPDDDATKVTAAAAGLSDLYEMENINTNNGIIGAQLLVCARRTEEGFAQLTPLLRHAGTTYPLAPRNVSPSYFYRNRDVFVTMPNGDPLTDANVNALQAGIRRTV